jgi:ABC-type enterochelin transport system permease subunit
MQIRLYKMNMYTIATAKTLTFKKYVNEFYKFHAVHYNTIVKENQQNAQIIYILSIYCTYMFRSLPTIIRVLDVTEYSNSTMCALVQIQLHTTVLSRTRPSSCCTLKIKS